MELKTLETANNLKLSIDRLKIKMRTIDRSIATNEFTLNMRLSGDRMYSLSNFDLPSMKDYLTFALDIMSKELKDLEEEFEKL